MFSLLFLPPEQTVLKIVYVNDKETRIYPTKVPVGESIWEFRVKQAEEDIASLQKGLKEVEDSPSSTGFLGPIRYSYRDVPVAFLMGGAPFEGHTLGRSTATKKYQDEIDAVRAQLQHYKFALTEQKIWNVVKDYCRRLAFLSGHYFLVVSVDFVG
jgi:hypothetical protein